MANPQSSIKFDHREIAVIFSLFIFVSLLMFTVGILVGKGLAQAKLEGASEHHNGATASHESGEEQEGHGPLNANVGTSITTGHENAEADSHHAPAHETKSDHGKKEEHAPIVGSHGDTHVTLPSPVDDETDGGHDEHGAESKTDLELVPKYPKNKHAAQEAFPKTKETESILKNPKMAGLFEGGSTASAPHRSTASVPTTLPKSFGQGKFTVQIGSYPNQREALERVEAVKKLGFPYAYLSAKDPGDQNTWYRVWLGYFPDEKSAKVSGEILQARGEVNSYLVRKADHNG